MDYFDPGARNKSSSLLRGVKTRLSVLRNDLCGFCHCEDWNFCEKQHFKEEVKEETELKCLRY